MQCRMRKESMANKVLGGGEQWTNCRINLHRVLDTWDPAKACYCSGEFRFDDLQKQVSTDRN
jgi:hypothetical protein